MKSQHRRLLIIGGVCAVALVVVKCSAHNFHTTVQSHELGVVRKFGVVQPDAMQPGLHLKMPWTKVEPVTMEYTDTPYMDGDTTLATRTADGYVIETPLVVTWAINPLNLTLVKSRQPGFYTDRENVIVRAAVRDAVSPLTLAQALDRSKLQYAVSQKIKAETVAYYEAQGYGSEAQHIVRYGAITIRDVRPPNELVQAKLDAEVLDTKSRLPAGRALAEYTKMIHDQAVAQALNDGRATVNVIDGADKAAAVVVGK